MPLAHELGGSLSGQHSVVDVSELVAPGRLRGEEEVPTCVPAAFGSSISAT